MMRTFRSDYGSHPSLFRSATLTAAGAVAHIDALVEPAGQQQSSPAHIRYERARLASIRAIVGDLARPNAWDLLLDLAEAIEIRRTIYVSDLGLLAGMPATTMYRYLEHLIDAGLATRTPDKNDRRKFVVAITALGIAKIDEHWATFAGRSVDQLGERTIVATLTFKVPA